MTGSGERVVVIGGGLAGITAALNLAEAGLPVVLLEARPWLGGATWSFGRRGLTIDNGQHVFLRCFTAYRDLLARLGVAESARLQERLDVTVLAPDGPVRLRRNACPAPTHLAMTLARYRPLTAGQRLALLPAATMMWLSDLAGPGSERASIGDWLSRHGQDERAISNFWELFLLPFMNAPAARTDQGTAAAFINAALLSHRDQADLGTAAVPLRDLHGGPAGRRLAQLGAEVRLGKPVAAVRRGERGRFVVQLDPAVAAAGEVPGQLALGYEAEREIHAAGVVLAVPAWAAASLLADELVPDAAGWSALRPAPVVSVHAIYDTRVMELPFAMTTGSPLRWIADKTGAAGLHTGQYLAASVPAAWSLVDEPPSAVRARLLPELVRLFPAAASARVEDFFVTRERSATFLPAPGTRSVRPGQLTRLAGLAIAGAWTDTGWPDTMEGAVRSGHLAAEVILTARAGRVRTAAGTPVSATAGRAIAAPGPAAPASDDVPTVPVPAVPVAAEPAAEVDEVVLAGEPVAEPTAQATVELSAGSPDDAEASEPAPAGEPAGPVAVERGADRAAQTSSAERPEDAAVPAISRALSAVPGTGKSAPERPAATVPAQRSKRKLRRQGPAAGEAREAGVGSERSQSAASP